MTNSLLSALAAFAFLLPADQAASLALQEAEREIAGIASRVASNVVPVQATFRAASDDNPSGSFTNVGSGFLLDSLGHVITAASVLSNSRTIAPVVSVIDHNDRTHEALLYDVDSTLRVAILYVPTMGTGYRMATKRNEWTSGVFALVVGNSFGVGPAVRLTTVAGKRARDGFWQLSDPATPGFSGAPVFDSRGVLGGVIVGEVAGQGREQRPLPAVMVTTRQLAPLMARIGALAGRGNRSWLGVSVRPFTQPDGTVALLVSNVISGSPAEQAGFVPGDIVTRVDTVDVNYVGDFAEWVRRSSPGDRATVQVLRQGVFQEVRVTIGAR